jgi:hypothetical protein
MRIKLFEQFTQEMLSVCGKCGEEFWDEDEICDDCKDSDLESKDYLTPEEDEEKHLPFFNIPTTKSQNLYYL